MAKAYKIAVLPGDGIGPEVTREAVETLRLIGEIRGFALDFTDYPFGADHYMKTKETFPPSALDELRGQNAILLGAIGDPRLPVGMLERAIISGIRFGLDLYVNLRPIKLFAAELCPLKGKSPEHIDMMVVRENTEDVYAGIGGFLKKGTPDEVAVQEMIFTRKGVERVIRYAFDLARSRGKARKLTLVDKANAVGAMDIWTRAFEEVGSEYSDIARDHAYIDAACMWMVKNPESFDTIVVSNMFGDILTDLGAAIQGGMGIAASGNIHPGRVSMFEPIHGSAPKHAGKNVASPIGSILAAQMLLAYLGEEDGAALVEESVAELFATGKLRSAGTDSGVGTREQGDLVRKAVRRRASSPTKAG
ncbi:MAG TPA: 3-isopropylmalate dehydrogenase [Candidatus Limnocylindrales bacterium]|nr:3-isopropylmalate dehydrogenase [Candidatus Limnocylindrales bacterium]